jgi:hypothetical protein
MVQLAPNTHLSAVKLAGEKTGTADPAVRAAANRMPEAEVVPVRLRAGVGGRRSGTRVYQFQSREDASVAPDPAVCAAAPFEPVVCLGAVLLPQDASTVDGEVTDGAPIGTATACLRFSDPTFPVGHAGQFYVAFDLPEGRVIAEGVVGVISNDVPASGVVVAACSLHVVSAPAGIRGGVATSLSVFKPGRAPGFASGSFWTLRLYVDE